MKNFYYFLKNLKIIFGKNFKIILIIFLLILLFFTFSMSVHAEDLSIAPQLSQKTAYLNPDTYEVIFNPYCQAFRDNYFINYVPSLQLTDKLKDYKFFISCDPQYSEVIVFLFNKEEDNIILTTGYSGSSGWLSFRSNTSFASFTFDYTKNSKNVTAFFNLLNSQINNYINNGVSFSKNSQNMRYLNVEFYLSNFNVYVSDYSEILPCYPSSSSDYIIPTLNYNDLVLSSYEQNILKNIQIYLNGFSNNNMLSYINVRVFPSDGSDNIINNYPLNPNITFPRGYVSFAPYIDLLDNNLLVTYDFSTIIPDYELKLGDKVEIFCYYDSMDPIINPQEINRLWSVSWTVGQAGSAIYTSAQGSSEGGGEEENPPEDTTNKELLEKQDQLIEQQKEQNETSKGIWETLKDLLSYINPFSENFFVYKLIDLLINALKSLFIPEEGFFDTFFNDLKMWFEERLGFLFYPFELIVDILSRMLNLDFSEPIFRIPDINEPFTNTKLISAVDYNLNSLLDNSVFKYIHDIYFIFVDAIIIFGLVNLAKYKFDEVTKK